MRFPVLALLVLATLFGVLGACGAKRLVVVDEETAASLNDKDWIVHSEPEAENRRSEP